jgi:hypothetical protein
VFFSCFESGPQPFRVVGTRIQRTAVHDVGKWLSCIRGRNFPSRLALPHMVNRVLLLGIQVLDERRLEFWGMVAAASGDV